MKGSRHLKFSRDGMVCFFFFFFMVRMGRKLEAVGLWLLVPRISYFIILSVTHTYYI